jgi:hypothetical protein
VLRIAQKNPDIFSMAALAIRKQGESAKPPDWLDHYLETVYEPTPADFKCFRALVRKNREIYESRYRDIRNKWFAHKEIADPTRISELFAKTANWSASSRSLGRYAMLFGDCFRMGKGQYFGSGDIPFLQ